MAIAVAHSAKATGAAVTSVTTPAISTTTGNMVVLHAGNFGTVKPTYSDTQSLTWTNVQRVAGGGSDALNWGLDEVYANGITGNGSHTFTATNNAGDYLTLVAREISGQAASSVLDKTAKNNSSNDGSVTSHTTSNTATTTQADELLLGAANQDTFTTATFSVSSPWTQDQAYGSDGTHCGIMAANRVVSATGAYPFVYTTNVNLVTNKMISTWKAAAAGFVPPNYAQVFGAD